jgi:signal transduction histidine kinase
MPPQITKDIGKIFSSSLYGREIVKKLLRFSLQLPPKKGLISFNTVINNGLEFVMPTCTSGGVTVIRSFDSSDPTILADETQIQQIIINIVVNALQAMLGGGTLTITTKALGDSVLLAVEDTGIGMNEDVLQHIFVPFFTTKADDSGTGLGLSIARDIVISHGGTITVTSTPWKGSRFEIRLPVSS